MKYAHIGLLLTSFFAVAGAAASPPNVLVARGQWKDDSYAVVRRWGDWDHLVAGGEFDIEKKATLSHSDAIALARRSLKEVVGTAHAHFFCIEITLRRHDSGGPNYWYYVVRFRSDQDLDAAKDKFSTSANLPFLVYFNAHVEPPYPTEPNKAPEPTLGIARSSQGSEVFDVIAGVAHL